LWSATPMFISLLPYLGCSSSLNAVAASFAVATSVSFTDNTTSASDLAVLWADEAKGKLGGAAAQAWLYPLLVGTATEAGIPAGVAARSVVVHKTGGRDAEEKDAALAADGPNGAGVPAGGPGGLGGAG